jgi:quinol monooxygenase YgiN
MSVARHYAMTATKGCEQALIDTLAALAALIRELPGCEAVALLRNVDAADRFHFIEKWASIEAHKSAGRLLPETAFDVIKAALASVPESSYLDYLALT